MKTLITTLFTLLVMISFGQYNMCDGNDTLTNAGGQFYDSGGASGSYGYNENCSVLIKPDCATDITLDFTYFYSPTSYDILSVYDGDDVTSPLIGNYAYISSTPPSITSTSGSLFLTFTSNGSSNYGGFAINWSSNSLNASAPNPNFTISNNNPPLGSNVSFTSTNINTPSVFTWHFGNGITSDEQNPSYAYNIPGTYDVKLIIENCYEIDSTTQTITVQEAPNISFSPSTISETITSCDDSITIPITITNSGLGELFYESSFENEPMANFNFFDGFENNSLNNWNYNPSANIYTIISADPASGDSCLSIIGNLANSFVKTLNADTYSYFSIKLKSESISGNNNYCDVGSGNASLSPSIARIYYNGSGSYQLTNAQTGFYAANDEWTHFELVDINYITKTFDLYVDGSLEEENVPFNNSGTNTMSTITLNNFNQNYYGYYDDIAVGTSTHINWAESSSPSGSNIISSASETFNVTLHSDSLNAGSYNSELIFNVNNVLALADTIPIFLTVVGHPIIELSDTCLNYGSVMQHTTVTDTFTIYNSGCDTLFVTNINPNMAEYTVNTVSTSILPNDSTLIIVSFTPTTVGNFDSFISVNNNDNDTTICLTGSSFGAPIITYSPLFINETISSCNDSIIVPITINNSGLSVLNTSIEIPNQLSGNINFFFDGFEDGNYDGWIESPTNTASSVVNVNPATGNNCLAISGNSTASLSYLFSPDTINYFSIKLKTNDGAGASNYCNIGNSGSSSGIAQIYHYNANSYKIQTGSGTISYSVPFPSPWVHFEFKNINYTTKSFDLFIDDTLYQSDVQFNFTGATNMSRIYLYNYDTNTTGYYDDIQIGRQIIPEWLSSTIDTLNILPGSSITFDLTLYSDSLNTGTYGSNVIFNSNDPLSSSDTIPVSLTIVGNPIIGFTETCLNYGNIMENTTLVDTLSIYNIGCDTLFISNIQPYVSEYTSNLSSTYILPDDSLKIAITFSPLTVGNYDSFISIYNNNIDTIVCLTGSAIESPQITFSPTSINETILSCNDSITVPVIITNDGFAALTGSVEVPTIVIGTQNYFFDGFEDGTYDNWIESGSTNIIEDSNPSSGNNYLSITGSTSNALDYDFPPDTIKYFSIKLKSDNNSGISNCCLIGNNPNDRIAIIYHYGSNSYYIQGGTTKSYSIINDWTHVELKNINYTTQTYDLYIDGTLQESNMTFYSNISSISKIKLYNYDHYYTGYYDDIQVGTPLTPQWVDSDIENINISPGSSTTFDVTLYSDSLNSGTYNSSVIFNTNDPLNPVDTIPVTLIIDGTPELFLLDTCLNYGSIMENTTLNDTLVIRNNGCDSLFISSVISGNPVYTTNWSNGFVLPNESINLITTFYPTSIGNFPSFLTITNNDIDTIICLSGTATGSPAIFTTPQEINITVDACSPSFDSTIYIHNEGTMDLNWQLIYANSINDNFDNVFNYSELWYDINNGTASSQCGTAGGTTALKFNGSGLRNAITDQIETGAVCNIQFYIKFGTGTAPCDYADLGEDVKLEYSLDNGSTWHNINTYVTTDFPNFTLINETIPLGALSSNTRFKWEQVAHDGSEQDIWLLDEVNITCAGANTPIPGNTIAGDSSAFNLNFNTFELYQGTYNRPIIITSNDPLNPTLIMNNTLTINEKPCANFGYEIPGACSGVMNFIDSTTNNPTTWSWSFGDGNTSNQQNPIHSYSVAGNYTVKLVTCTNNLCDSMVQVINIQNTFGPLPTSCIPNSSTSSTSNGITLVSLNTINNSSTMSASGYQDFSCDESTTLMLETAYNIEISTPYYTGNKTFYVWLDMNNDGEITTQELLNSSSNSGNTIIIPLTVPASTQTLTPLRMRVSYSLNVNAHYPCGYVSNGEYEDYTVTLEPNNQPPIANFSTNEINNCDGIFQFTDNSTKTPTSWLWDFGDGTTSSNQNPTHTYSTSGTYIVSLVVTNSFGSDTFLTTIFANLFTNCSIETNSVLSNNLPIQFTTNCANASLWQWDFGDGTQSYIQSPVHLYTEPGEYTVTLIAQNDLGCYSSTSQLIELGSIGIEEDNQDISLYPNPNNGKFNIINTTNLTINQVTIMNSLGEIVYLEKQLNPNSEINIQHLPTGIYFIEIKLNNGSIVTKKIVTNK